MPPPKNEFSIKVNGYDYYTLVKEDIDYDPSKVETLKCESIKLNNIEAHRGSMPWILDEVEEKLNKVYQGQQLESLEIHGLDCKSSVANLFLDFMASLDLKNDSFKNLVISKMTYKCIPIEDDVLSRLAQSCSRLEHLEMTEMNEIDKLLYGFNDDDFNDEAEDDED